MCFVNNAAGETAILGSETVNPIPCERELTRAKGCQVCEACEAYRGWQETKEYLSKLEGERVALKRAIEALDNVSGDWVSSDEPYTLLGNAIESCKATLAEALADLKHQVFRSDGYEFEAKRAIDDAYERELGDTNNGWNENYYVCPETVKRNRGSHLVR